MKGPQVFSVGGATITFHWIPQPKELATALFALAGALEDTTQPILASRALFQDDMAERFETNTDPEGNPWAPWAREYDDSTFALKRTMALYGAAISEAAWPIADDSIFFNSGPLPGYGMIHQTGALRFTETMIENFEFAKRARKMGLDPDLSGLSAGNELPARPFVGPSTEAQAGAVAIFAAWFDGAVAAFSSTRGRYVRHSTGQLTYRRGGKFARLPGA